MDIVKKSLLRAAGKAAHAALQQFLRLEAKADQLQEAVNAMAVEAAIGRAVIAAAEQDGPERQAMADAIDGQDIRMIADYAAFAAEAARAIIDFAKEGKA